jgi:hypothetical protein
MTPPPAQDSQPNRVDAEFYCPRCEQPVSDPLMCGDCASLICRRCGSPLERIDDLGIG